MSDKLTEAEARAIGKAIRDEAEIVALPIKDPIERRAICLRLAIKSKARAISLEDQGSIAFADDAIAIARKYHAYIIETQV